MPDIEYKINKYLKLKLVNNSTVIYVNEVEFIHCKYLLLINPQEYEEEEAIDSIDEAGRFLSGELEQRVSLEDLDITYEQEFWGHSSNLEVWAENGYDTRLLHSNLSFPLLKKLAEVGDPQAKRVLKDEIAERILSGYIPVINYIINQGFLSDVYLNEEERDSLINELEIKLKEGGFRFIDHTLAKDWSNLAVAFNRLNKPDIAIELFKKAISLNPKDADTWIEFGIVYDNREEWDKAIEMYKRSIEIQPDSSIAHYDLGIAYEGKRDNQNAIEAYKRATEIDPNYKDAYNNMGNCYEEIGLLDEALEAYNKATDIDPDFAMAIGNKGLAFNGLKEYDTAIEHLEHALEIDPEYVSAWNNLGISYFYKKDYAKSKEAYKKCREIDNEYDLAYSNLSELYDLEENYEKTIAMAERSLEINPENYEGHYFLGRGSYYLGDFDRAIESFQRALNLDIIGKRKFSTKDSVVRYNLARAYLKKGDLTKAKRVLKRSLEENPDYQEAIELGVRLHL